LWTIFCETIWIFKQGSDRERFIQKLVIFESAHPLGPVVGVGAAGSCPGPADVETPVPPQRPQLFHADLACGPVAEDGVLESAVAVDTGPLHLLRVDGAGNGGGAIGRDVGVAWPGVDPPHAGEHGDVVGPLDVRPAPMVGGGTSAPHAVETGRHVAHPAVRPVAANVVVGSAAVARLPGVVGPVADVAGGGRFGRLRADADLLLDRVEVGYRLEPPATAAAAAAAEPVAIVVIAIQLIYEIRNGITGIGLDQTQGCG